MVAKLIDGKAVAAKVQDELRVRVATLAAQGVRPGLAVILVGDDPASQIYVRLKERRALKTGIHSVVHRLPATATQQQVLQVIGQLNADPTIHGMLVQLPLPPHLDTKQLIDHIDPIKDVDGLHPINIGRLHGNRPSLESCTPQGVMRLLREYEVPLEGRHAVVLGRSAIVGRPMSWLLLRAHATVTTCHRHTTDVAKLAGQADILVSAVGKPGLVRGDWIKPGATVIDVGINRLANGKIVGDVAFDEARERAALITPVPGGVGPMTIAMLLSNVTIAAERAHYRHIAPSPGLSA